MSAWYDASGQSRLQAAWPGAPIENEETLGFILDTAREQVEAWAPAPDPDADPTDIPSHLVYAQLLQAQRLWAAGTADENGDIGTEGYSFVPRPLDKTIKNIIRPQRGDIGGGF